MSFSYLIQQQTRDLAQHDISSWTVLLVIPWGIKTGKEEREYQMIFHTFISSSFFFSSLYFWKCEVFTSDSFISILSFSQHFLHHQIYCRWWRMGECEKERERETKKRMGHEVEEMKRRWLMSIWHQLLWDEPTGRKKREEDEKGYWRSTLISFISHLIPSCGKRMNVWLMKILFASSERKNKNKSSYALQQQDMRTHDSQSWSDGAWASGTF